MKNQVQINYPERRLSFLEARKTANMGEVSFKRFCHAYGVTLQRKDPTSESQRPAFCISSHELTLALLELAKDEKRAAMGYPSFKYK